MGIILFVCNMGLYLHFYFHFLKTWPCPGNSRCETMIYSFPGEHVEKSLQENESFGFNMDHSYGFKVSTFSGPHVFYFKETWWCLIAYFGYLRTHTHIYTYIIYIIYIYISHVSICFSVWWSIHVHPPFCWRGRCSEKTTNRKTRHQSLHIYLGSVARYDVFGRYPTGGKNGDVWSSSDVDGRKSSMPPRDHTKNEDELNISYWAKQGT